MKVVVTITVSTSQDYVNAKQSLQRFRRQAQIMALSAMVCAVGLIIAVLSKGDDAIIALFTLAPATAVFGVMTGITYFSGVRDTKRQMRSYTGTAADRRGSDPLTKTELATDMALYAIASMISVASLYIVISGAIRDLSTADPERTDSIFMYVTIVSLGTVFIVGALIWFLRRLRDDALHWSALYR